MTEPDHILRPLPRRIWRLGMASLSREPSTASQPNERPDPLGIDSGQPQTASSTSYNSSQSASTSYNSSQPSTAPGTPSLAPLEPSRSIVNLTSSTLFGIYTAPGASSGTGSNARRSAGFAANADGSFRNADDYAYGGAMTPFGLGSATPNLTAPPTPKFGADEDAEEKRRQAEDTFSDKRSPNSREPATTQGPSSNHLIAPPQHTAHLLTILSYRVFQLGLLFGLGMAYGLLINTLHANPQIAPVQVVGTDHSSWHDLLFWGGSGVAWGMFLPWIDSLVKANAAQSPTRRGPSKSRPSTPVKPPAPVSRIEWIAVVRGIGAFIGVAFAIRKLPWESTLQASLTLALANPVLWYLVDSTAPGFFFSTLIALAGTVLLPVLNHHVVPSSLTPPPSRPQFSHASLLVDPVVGRASSFADPIVSAPAFGGSGPALGPLATAPLPESVASLSSRWNEQLAIWTWIASVLFCSCICFGNLGRRLAWDGVIRPAVTESR